MSKTDSTKGLASLFSNDPKKETSNEVSKLASDILSGRINNPTIEQIKKLAGSVLSQDETKGQR